MAYGLYNTLDVTYFRSGDYSDADGITGTIYTDKARSSAKNLTGYTLTLFIYDRLSRQTMVQETASIVVAGNGTWRYYFTSSVPVPVEGVYDVEIELKNSTEIISTYPEEILCRWSPKNE